MVGRGGSGEDNSDALLQALKERQATASVTAAPATGSAANTAKAKGKAQAKKDAKKGEGKVVATENGDIHEVANFKASKQKEEEDTRIVEENPEQVGADYITAQQNLPDVVVVGGDGGSAPAPSGVEP